MDARIAPIDPPYSSDVAAWLAKWMPPGIAVPPLALFRTLVRHPSLSERMRPLGSALLARGVLPPRVRELLLLRTCARCGAEYEWGVHVTGFAAAVGLDDDAVRATALATPEAIAARDDEDAWILRLADELHDRATVSDATWAALAARFDDAAWLEAIAVCGFYHLIAFVANAARVEREPWAASFPSASAS